LVLIAIGKCIKLKTKPGKPLSYREPATLNQELDLFLFWGTPSALGA
jgi:hypothetical protein